MSNPLIGLEGLPPFSQIKAEHILPALEQGIAHCKDTIEQVLAQDHYTWDNFIAPLDEADDKLTRLWSPVSHMHSVVNSDELRAAYDKCLPLISEYSTFVGQHQGLYLATKSIVESDEFANLSPAQQKAINNSLRDFKLSGITLDADKQKRYGEIATRLSELAAKFGNNVMDATLAWQKQINDESELTGLPESAIALAKHTAESKELEGWLFTLDFPSYLPVMTHSDNRALRQETYSLCLEIDWSLIANELAQHFYL